MANEQKKQRAEQIRANQEAAGIPDSKAFGGYEELPSGVSRILECHIDGVAVADMNLMPQVLVALDYWSTDEGVAERNARPNVVESSGITLGAEPWDKSLQQRRDDVKQRDMPLYDSRDPLKEVADRYAKPGMKPMFLRADNVRNGGSGEYVIVKKENGDPATVKGMVLGHIPIEMAEARAKHYQARGNQMLNQVIKQYKQEGGETAVVDK